MYNICVIGDVHNYTVTVADFTGRLGNISATLALWRCRHVTSEPGRLHMQSGEFRLHYTHCQ